MGIMPDNAPAKWLTIPQAVAETGKSERTIRRWIAEKRLATRRESGRVLVNLADLPPAYSAEVEAGQRDDCQARVRQLEADITRLSELLAEVRGERDYLRQLHAMKEARQLEAATPPARRTWRWPWGK
jgi:hypothetical protein